MQEMEISELREVLSNLEHDDDEEYWEAVSDAFMAVAYTRSKKRREMRKMNDASFHVVPKKT